jgi:hypothetical protein
MDDQFDDVRDPMITSCSTVHLAGQFLNRTLALATKHDVEQITRAFFGIRERDVRKIRKKLSGGQEDSRDFRITSMLSLGDTHHDFKEFSDSFVLEKTKHTPLPRGVTVKTLKNERALITKLSNLRTLTFSSSTIINPMHGAKFLDVFNVRKFAATAPKEARSIEGLILAQIRHMDGKYRANLVHADVTTIRNLEMNDVMKLRQVASVVSTLRQLYGSRNYLVDADASQPLIKLMFAFKNLQNAFFTKFATVPWTDELASMSAALQALVNQRMQVEFEPMGSVQTTDAGIFDPALNSEKLEVDPRPTGALFGSSQFPYEVTLRGCEDLGHGRVVNVLINEREGTTLNLSLTSKQCAKYISKNHIAALITKRAENDAIDKRLSLLREETLFAMKRAGDWGQVEHCKMYSKIFVTRDRMAALYAHYRGIKYVFMSFDDHTNEQLAPWLPFFFRYTFVMKR